MKNTPQLALLKIFILFGSCQNFLLEGDRGVLIDGIDFVRIGAEVVKFLAGNPNQRKQIFIRFLIL